MTRRSLLLALPLSLLVSVAIAAVGPDDRVIDLTQRVGAVTAASTLADIVKVYGAKNLAVARDGLSVVIFPGTPDEVRVEFKAPRRSPWRVLIAGQGGAWATAGGLRVGTTMAELQALNGGPFDITGANWTEPARVVSWKGGNLPAQLYVDLGPAGRAEMDAATKRSLRSRQTFYSSESRVFRDFSVRRIVLEW